MKAVGIRFLILNILSLTTLPKYVVLFCVRHSFIHLLAKKGREQKREMLAN